MLYERSCPMKGAAQGTNSANKLVTILLAKILMPLLCTIWHVCFWHGHHVGKLGNILMKKRNIGMLCHSNYLADILDKYLLGFKERVREIIFWPTFSPILNCTSMFGWYWSTRWPTYWRSLSPFISLWTQDFVTDFWWDHFPNNWFLS